MSKIPYRPVPDLTDSTLVPIPDGMFVDSATGMVLRRIGYVNTLGYEYVNLEGRCQAVHRVVFAAVVGPIPDGLTINHLDADKLNNHPSNLEAVTHAENVAHANRLGLRGRPTRPPVRKRLLTPDQVAAVKAAVPGTKLHPGTIREVAAFVGITPKYAYQIRSGRSCYR